jgi:radical SAM superfamily enzyme YgiQ (UPF0313 family)
MPLGLGYLASFILSKNKDIQIKVIDTGVSTQKKTEELLRQPYDAAGITVTSRTYREAVEIAKAFRQGHPAAPIIFGGPHVSIMMQEIMNEPVIDLAVYGEGELTFNELLGLLRDPKLRFNIEALSKIDGLIFRTPEKIIVNKAREFIKNLDTLPFPAFGLFPMDKYTGKLPMITSRGCPFACVFCASSEIWKRKWRARSPENIIEEVQYLIKQFGATPIDFHDDGFNMNLKRVNAICDAFIAKKVKVPWGIRGFRADMVNTATAKKMRRAGCSHVAIGIESANPEMLTRMGKKESIEQIAAGIKTLRSAGIDVIGQFMIGNPGETIDTVKQSIKFAGTSGLTKAIFGTAVPFPKTGLWKYVEENGRFLVEPDCTTFEEIEPRIIFETPEFTAKQKLLAIKMVQQAGMMDDEKKKKSFSRKLFNKVIFRYLFKLLPSQISFQLYFFLRGLRRKIISLRMSTFPKSTTSRGKHEIIQS